MNAPHSCAARAAVCLCFLLGTFPPQASGQGTDQARRLCDQAHYPEAARILKTIIAASSRSQQERAEASALLASCQERFLSSWNRQAQFYSSGDSRLDTLNLKTLRKETVFQLTQEVESKLGEQAFTQIQSSARQVQESQTVAFIQQIASRLVERSPGLNFGNQVVLIDSPDVTAISPPGRVIVTTGLLRFVATETELAAVLAHELAHGYAHHAGRRLLKELQGRAVLNQVASALNPQSETARVATLLISSAALTLFVNAYNRYEEAEADRYSTHILFNADYNPTALATVFLELYKANPRQPIKFLSTHPPAPDRVDNVTAYLEAFPLDRELLKDSTETFATTVKARYPGSRQAATEPQPPPPPPAGQFARASGAVVPPPSLPAFGTSTRPLPQPPPPLSTPAPASSADVPPPASDRRDAVDVGYVVSAWVSEDGAMQVALRNTAGIVELLVRVVPPYWPATRVSVGDVVFRDGRAGEDGAIRGTFVNLPPFGQCTRLPTTYAPASIAYDAASGAMKLTVRQLKVVVPECRWSDEYETRTITWRRVAGGDR